MASKKNKKSSSGISRKGLLIWISLTFVASAWMFVLGIIVGRGTAPVRFDIENLQRELALLRETGIMKELRKYKIDSDVDRQTTEMGFYETLKDANKAVELKVDKQEQPSKPVAEDTNSETEKTGVLEREKSKTTQNKGGPVPVDSKMSEHKPYTIQVASLRDLKKAEKMVAGLKKRGFPAYRVAAEIPGKGTWYRVRVGAYMDKKEASIILDRLNESQVKGMIVLR